MGYLPACTTYGDYGDHKLIEPIRRGGGNCGHLFGNI